MFAFRSTGEGALSWQTVLSLCCLLWIASPAEAEIAVPTTHTNSADAERVWWSKEYGYSIKLPRGWIRIPNKEIAKFQRDRLPPQANHMVWDAAFQRGNPSNWFQWPYLIVQVIPSSVTKLQALPTEAQFSQLVKLLGSGRLVKSEKMQDAIAAVPDVQDRATAQSILASFSTVYTNEQSRKYWMFANAAGRGASAGVTVLIVGQFLPNGSMVQLNSYTDNKTLLQTVSEVMEVSASIHSVAP